MSKVPLLEELIKYNKENNIPFSMPGNKGGLAFRRDEIGRYFEKNLGRLDITEVGSLDNLHSPEGVIKEAQNLLKDYYKCKKAFFCVNGSTGGNLAAIFSAFNEGDEVIVERNCHKSIYNGLILRKLKVIYIEPVIMKNGVLLPPNKEKVYDAINRSNNPKGIILTYPNYYGISYDIEELIKEIKIAGLKVIIDEAHGAHFGVCEKLPKNMASIADYIVVSAHKTLPTLTGGSYLLVNDMIGNVEFYYSAFMTTSPSYLIMASLDYARHYLQEYGEKDYLEFINLCEIWREKINEIGKVKIIGKEDLPFNYEMDKTRYLIILEEGYSGHKLFSYLKRKSIQGEMSIDKGVVLILSPSQGEEELKRLYEVIKKLNIEELVDKYFIASESYSLPIKRLEPYEVFELAGKECEIEKSEGKIVKESIIPYPPGIPIICAGEVISSEIISKIKSLLENNIKVLGIRENTILIAE